MVTEKEQLWLQGYMEGNGSFHLVINLLDGKKKNRVILKPYISIANRSAEQMEYLKELIGIHHHNISDKKRDTDKANKLFVIPIQNFDDIDNFIAALGKYTFISPMKQHAYEKFLEAYEKVQKIGQTHTSWDERMRAIIDIKEDMNANLKKEKTSVEYWCNRIKEHLDK